ncbi:MAG: response regulator transcription factor [Microbacterium sp.]|uniref:response regulator n=1 Tax=Microbacterium sp. TaxID=51671 RepID=UPI00262A7811|nr:response regulator transcription factor [Microbacterium sp.]MCX6501744.1 response regulator transcription factor [Microbacterium sp.]
MIRVVIADDQPLIRRAVAQLLRGEPDIDVVGEAENGAEARDLAGELRPDVIVMDIRMPVLDGIDATAAICADPALADTRVLVLTTFEDDEYVVAALRAGASGFIGKGAEPEEIGRAVRAVHAGDALLSPVATRALIGRYLQAAPARAAIVDPSNLTAREQEILVLVARGLSNDEIAAELFISAHTAKTHLKRIMAKLGAHDRAQCVIYAYESGLVVVGPAV